MEIEFDFKKEESKIFGPILRPVARIILINNSVEVPEHLYVDSGADISLIPKSLGDLLECQKPQVTDLWHVNATLRVVFDHSQNSTRHPTTRHRRVEF